MHDISVLIVDDHQIFRVGLARVLTAAGIPVAAEAATGPEAVSAARKHRPDIVLLDVALPGFDGFEVCRTVINGAPGTIVLFLTSYTDAASVRHARIAGARALLSKDAAPSSILAAIAAATADATWHDFPATAFSFITDREMDVLERLGRGLSQPEIARSLGLATETVKSYVKEIYGKLGVHDRASALREARQHGLLFDPPGTGVTNHEG